MADWFEDFTKTIADDKLTRRQAVGSIAGVVAGATIAVWLPEQVLAKTIPWKKQCPNGSTCETPVMFCNGNPNTNCFCLTGMFSSEPRGFCGRNSYCSQLSTCINQSDCRRGTVCSYYNACNCQGTSGVCITACKGKHKNCQLGSGHGLTATGRML